MGRRVVLRASYKRAPVVSIHAFLDFIQLPSSSRSESERFHNAFKKDPWNGDDIVLRRRPTQKRSGPKVPAHTSQRLGNGWQGFRMPGSVADRERGIIHEVMSTKSDERTQPQQGRRGVHHGQIRPLALRLDAQMGSHVMNAHLDRPAHDTPCQDLKRVSMVIGVKHGLRGACALRVANEHPAYGNGWDASKVPQALFEA